MAVFVLNCNWNNDNDSTTNKLIIGLIIVSVGLSDVSGVSVMLSDFLFFVLDIQYSLHLLHVWYIFSFLFKWCLSFLTYKEHFESSMCYIINAHKASTRNRKNMYLHLKSFALYIIQIWIMFRFVINYKLPVWMVKFCVSQLIYYQVRSKTSCLVIFWFTLGLLFMLERYKMEIKGISHIRKIL